MKPKYRGWEGGLREGGTEEHADTASGRAEGRWGRQTRGGAEGWAEVRGEVA